MRVMRLTTIGIVALASAAVALGQGGTPPAGRQANTKDPEQVICRRLRDTSSLAGSRRECRTRANWDRIAQENRANSPMTSAMSGGSSSNN